MQTLRLDIATVIGSHSLLTPGTHSLHPLASIPLCRFLRRRHLGYFSPFAFSLHIAIAAGSVGTSFSTLFLNLVCLPPFQADEQQNPLGPLDKVVQRNYGKVRTWLGGSRPVTSVSVSTAVSSTRHKPNPRNGSSPAPSGCQAAAAAGPPITSYY